MIQNTKLFKETLGRDGSNAAIGYLTEHENLTHDAAVEYTTNYLLEDTQASFNAVFEHFCMRDSLIWVGDKDSKCPECYTDGVIEDTVPGNSRYISIKNAWQNLVLLKRKVLG